MRKVVFESYAAIGGGSNQKVGGPIPRFPIPTLPIPAIPPSPLNPAMGSGGAL